ncbi:MAG: hypothetical protein J6U48_02450, partial [Alistipes sp.]|nr:hypothetical protein [Alistipes sp.]
MRRKIFVPVILISLLCGALFYAASGHNYHYAIEYDAIFSQSQSKKSGSSDRHMVDMLADDSYLIEQGDSTIFILVGNFAAHHNGTVILADSAVRYPNQSFECFGNVLINQNDTYAYGDRAEYNRANSTATIYSELVKVVDGEAVMYTYDCTFDTEAEVGHFYNGCYVKKDESHLEAERGYYYTKSHELIAVDNVEMHDDKYIMKGDSVIFNTQTEDAQYFTNTNIWNDKDEYLYADEGTYTKALDLHHLKRNAYILTQEQEVWSDTIEYYRTTGHIIGRSNIQMDDTTQKILGFADYGEWWDDMDNALFTRRPSMINYNPDEPDSLYLCADTLWLNTIPVLPPVDSTALNNEEITEEAARSEENTTTAMEESIEAESEPAEEDATLDEGTVEEASEALMGFNREESADDKTSEGDKATKRKAEEGGKPSAHGKRRTKSQEEPARELSGKSIAVKDSATAEQTGPKHDEEITEENVAAEGEESMAVESDSLAVDSIMVDTARLDTLAVDSLAEDSIKPLTRKQLRYRAKLERRRVRDSIRNAERLVQDSLDSIKRIELDSIKHIKDSLLRIEIDSIVAKRIAQSSKLADEEKARLERVKQKTEERNRRKIDKAKARALRRGKVYTGPDYTIDSVASEETSAPDTLAIQSADSLAADSLAADTTQMDSLARDTMATTPPFPEDSVYKMIKAYRHVKMYRPDSQM